MARADLRQLKGWLFRTEHLDGFRVVSSRLVPAVIHTRPICQRLGVDEGAPVELRCVGVFVGLVSAYTLTNPITTENGGGGCPIPAVGGSCSRWPDSNANFSPRDKDSHGVRRTQDSHEGMLRDLAGFLLKANEGTTGVLFEVQVGEPTIVRGAVV